MSVLHEDGWIDTGHSGLADDVTRSEFEATILWSDRDMRRCVDIFRRETCLAEHQRAMAKQLAWAAPSSSSGLVPALFSNREPNDYGPLNIPWPKSFAPWPRSGCPPSVRALCVSA